MLPTLIHRRGRPFWDAAFDLWPQACEPRTEPSERGTESSARLGLYPVDIHEDDQHIVVEAEVPGFTKDQVQVTLDGGVLTISAERDVPGERAGTTHLAQRRYTRVHRRFSMPETVDEQQVEATLEHGVLRLQLAKRAEAQPRKIEVK